MTAKLFDRRKIVAALAGVLGLTAMPKTTKARACRDFCDVRCSDHWGCRCCRIYRDYYPGTDICRNYDKKCDRSFGCGYVNGVCTWV
jgi:hypothetical protein